MRNKLKTQNSKLKTKKQTRVNRQQATGEEAPTVNRQSLSAIPAPPPPAGRAGVGGRHPQSAKKPQETVKERKSEKSDKKIQVSTPNTKSSQKPASSMDELMARRGGDITPPTRGKILNGTVTEITGRVVLVDIGGKTEGMVADREFDEARDFIKSLSVGDTVQAYVLSPENDRGQILLSFRSAAQRWQWAQLDQWKQEGKVIEVRGLEVNKGGVVVRIDTTGLQGFVPGSHLGSAWSKNPDGLINRVFSVKIVEIDRPNNRVIFSERFVSEAGEIAARKDVLAGVHAGMKVKATVVGITDFGAFARTTINGHEIEGLIHISELSWQKVDRVEDVLNVGQEVELVVLDVDSHAGKIGFSLKKLQGDPWNGIESRYPPGKKIRGNVSKVASFGAFIQLEPGVSGLLHISKIPTGKEPEVGQEIDVIVEDLDRDHRRLALGMVGEEIPTIYR